MNTPRLSLLAGSFFLVLTALTARSAPTVTLSSLLTEMTNRDALARWPEPTFTSQQTGSWDRRSKTPKEPEGWFANGDYSDALVPWLRYVTNGPRRECVLMDVAGPGAITRFWTGGKTAIGMIRFYFDGASEPAIAAPMQDLLCGRNFVPRPLGIENPHEAGNLYLPIPFARHCLITYAEVDPKKPGGPPPQRWWNIEYRAYAADAAVRTFTMEDFKAQRALVEQVCQTLSVPPALAGGREAALEKSLEPGQEVSIDLPAGNAAVRELEVKLSGVADGQLEQSLRSTVLRATFDGEQTIWCPLGEFSGSGVGVNELQSWARTVRKDGPMTCRWVMPYEKSARLSLLNTGQQRVDAKLTARVGDWTWDRRSMHFHATWRHQYPIPTRPFRDWNYLTVAGRGVHVGDTLAVFNPVKNWWGEGDEKVWVDGESFPSHFGTGTEDHYGYAWGTPVLFQGPFCNQPRAGAANRGHTTNTRIRVLDAVPFTKSLQYDMEIWHWDPACQVAYSVATYWYAFPGATTTIQPAPAEAARDIPQLPQPKTLRGAVECETMKILAKNDGLKVGRQQNYPFDQGAWSGDSQLFVQARQPGDFLELLLAENLTGPRQLALHATKSYDYGLLRLSVNGQPVPQTFDGYAPKPLLTGPVELGTFAPKDGRLVLRVEVIGANPAATGPKYYFGLDAVTLAAP